MTIVARYALSAGAATALLAGCGAPQSPIGALGALPQSRAPVTENRSWMDANARKWDLLYVANDNGTVTVYRYFNRQLVGTLTGFNILRGECVDKEGNVFITDAGSSKVFEYAHGDREPLNVISEGKDEPNGCSVDPVTNKLAVANSAYSSPGNIAVYNAAGKLLHTYSMAKYFYRPLACAYDDRSDLFATGTIGSTDSYFAELAKRSATFIGVRLLPSETNSSWDFVQSIQWDGKYVEVGEDSAYRFAITRLGGSRFEGVTSLNGQSSQQESWVTNFSGRPDKQGTQIVAAGGEGTGRGTGSVMYWKYPAGGAPIASITDGIFYPWGVAVSLKQK